MTVDMPHTCPSCGREQDAMTGRPGATPSVGDVGICWACGGAGVFTGTGLRAPTAAEAADIDADPEVVRVRAAIAAAATPLGAAAVVWGSS